MKPIRRLPQLLLPSLAGLLIGAAPAQATPRHADAVGADSAIHAAAWLVVDGESGRVLGEHDADAERQPASLTKLMTAYVVLDALRRGALRLDETLRVDGADLADLGQDEARMYLVAGRSVTVEDLVGGLIVASANDAAMVLARRVGGSRAGFEQRMNDTARRLGMTHTHYTTPSGITTPGNHSTARDLATLARRLTADFPVYYRYSARQQFVHGSFHKRNKNWLLGSAPGVDGLKTGHTQAAGYCIVATARRRQAAPPMARRVFAVVLGAPSASARIDAGRRLLDEAYAQSRDLPGKDGVVTQIVR
ncbi:D-alanyl-D-alanine carboxypeptidase family protein [Burkholderia gladioli]|uniref:D-alanyl-D-alanine carboxypeptidase family protein n=1 Tax=Burkholderia gladioli TaxID=28095 RepID=UPI000CFE56BA|nr:D-alanyl-D-alanine carboxypeptidase family protein [Burkholderia gladioli]PRG98930.1 D-alanyl-D-alanine carboxypeptidase [Burkholderia gladioli]